jgi:hypothetical protein
LALVADFLAKRDFSRFDCWVKYWVTDYESLTKIAVAMALEAMWVQCPNVFSAFTGENEKYQKLMWEYIDNIL